MKARDTIRLNTLRLLMAELKNNAIAVKPESESAVVKRYANKLEKTEAEYVRLDRRDHAEASKAERAIVEEFLPKKLSPDQTAELVDEMLAGKAVGPRDLGKAIGQIMKAHGEEVDGKLVGELVKRRLQA